MNTKTDSPPSDSAEAQQGAGGDCVSRLVLCLFEARRDAKNARKLWQEKAAEIGKCDGCDEEDGPCYLQRNPDLCDVCATKQPFWEARQKASIAAGVALRRVLSAGKFLSENNAGVLAHADEKTL